MAEQESDEKAREEHGKKRVWEECKHGTWLSPCPICEAEQGLHELKREHFIRVDLDKDHHYYSFGINEIFEICLEPCAAGFDVALFTCVSDPTMRSLIEPKQCTKTGDYTRIDALFGDRKDEDWNRALEIANELFDKFTEKFVRDRYESIIREMLIPTPKTGMKCMFCGCTDDHACPSGCSWAAPNVCSRCADMVIGNDLISREEIIALRSGAKIITMKDGLRLTMKGGFMPVIPMPIKSGYGVSLTIINNHPDRNPIEVFSVGSRKGRPDPADSEVIATAVLGEGYTLLQNRFPSKRMVHFWKRRG